MCFKMILSLCAKNWHSTSWKGSCWCNPGRITHTHTYGLWYNLWSNKDDNEYVEEHENDDTHTFHKERKWVGEREREKEREEEKEKKEEKHGSWQIQMQMRATKLKSKKTRNGCQSGNWPHLMQCSKQMNVCVALDGFGQTDWEGVKQWKGSNTFHLHINFFSLGRVEIKELCTHFWSFCLVSEKSFHSSKFNIKNVLACSINQFLSIRTLLFVGFYWENGKNSNPPRVICFSDHRSEQLIWAVLLLNGNFVCPWSPTTGSVKIDAGLSTVKAAQAKLSASSNPTLWNKLWIWICWDKKKMQKSHVSLD